MVSVKCQPLQREKERYNSVYNGLKELKDVDYVMIHDGARPCINSELLHRLITGVMTDEAVVPAVPSKDTIRLADDNGYVISTPKLRLRVECYRLRRL